MSEPRSHESAITIHATPDDVWRALTDADELVRWFPLDARVTPGQGGKVWISWGAPWEGEGTIAIWEPGRRLRIDQGLVGLTVDYFIEGKGGGGGGETVLRVVTSGFEKLANWEDEWDGTKRGWRFELEGLRHYLQHHRGARRQVAWITTSVAVSAAAGWSALLGNGGFFREGSVDGLKAGARYRLVSVTGDAIERVVHINEPPRDFSGTVAALGNGLIRFTMDHTGMQVWLSAWGRSQSEIRELEARWAAKLAELLPDAGVRGRGRLEAAGAAGR